MEKSLNEVMARHDVLRTVFTHKKTDEILQVVLRKRSIDFHYEDLRGLKSEEQASYQQAFLEQDRQRSFDLNKDVLIRVSLLQLAKGEYVFIWSFHHILMDGWCTGILIREFLTIYESLAANQPPVLPDAGHYRSFIQWIEGRDETESKAFWNQYLEGFTDPTGIRSVKGTHQQEYDNQEISVVLDESITQQINAFVRENQVTLNTFFQALWGVLLARYNDTRDVVFGSVCSIRPAQIADVEHIVGLFINTLPTRIRFDQLTTFQQLLRTVHTANSEADPHKYVPLSTIQSLTSQKSKLFDHLFIFENFPLADIVKEDADVALHQQSFSQTNYPFNLIIVPGSCLTLKLNFDANTYPQAFVQRLAQHLHTLLGQALRLPQQPLDQLPLLTPGQQHQLVQDGLGQPAHHPCPPLTHWLAHWAHHQPHHPALITPSSQLSYLHLHQHVLALAHYLRHQMQIQPGQCVALLLDREADWLISLLALWQIGAVYLPINPSLPPARRQAMLEAGQARLLLTDAERLVEALDLGLPLVALDLQREQWLRGGLGGDWAPVSSEVDAYLIFTSGTSGVPKGVPISQGALSLRTLDHAQQLGLSPADRVLQYANQSFDASLMEVGMCLVGGASLVLVPEAIKHNTVQLGAYLHQQAVSVAILPPASLQELLEEPTPGGLRQVITTGESARLGVSVGWLARGVRVWNGYGPTEVCVGASLYELNRSQVEAYQRAGGIPLGRALGGLGVWVVDRQGRLLPPGVAGELVIGGVGLSRGYISGGDGSRFTEVGGLGRVYWSGDVGYRDEAGLLHYLGRRDGQVQVRGIRVEPEGVEQVLSRLAGVESVAVVGRGAGLSSELVGYVVLGPGVEVGSLRRQAQGVLASYQVPSEWRVVSRLPLTANGKVDKKALSTIEPVEKPTEAYGEVPASPEEIAVAAAFAQVLSKAIVGRQDNFFDLGGDSIKAIQISSRLYRAGYQTDARIIFAAPCVHELASRLLPVNTSVDQTEVTGPVPLMPIQDEFLSLNRSALKTFIQAVVFKAQTRLNPDSLGTILTMLHRQHDALRMTVQTEAPQVTQYNQATRSLSVLRVFDLTDSPDAESAFRNLWKKVKEEIDLQKGSLLNAVVFRFADHDRLGLVAHHWVMDGISWRILLEDLFTLVRQSADELPLQLPTKTESFKTWAEALYQHANSDKFIDNELTYWQHQADKLHQSITSHRKSSYWAGRPVQRQLTAEMTQHLLTGVQQTYRIKTDELLLAALSLAVKQVFAIDRLAVLLEGHGREQITDRLINVDRTIGWFTSTCPVVIPCLSDELLSDQLIAVKETIAAIPTKRLGYGLLKYTTSKVSEVEKATLPTSEVVFNYLGQFDNDLAATTDFELIPDADQADTSLWLSHPLQVSSLIAGGELKLTLRFDAELFCQTQMDSLADQFITQLEKLIRHCQQQKFPVLTPSDVPLSNLSASGLTLLQDRYAKELNLSIIDVYPLTPMQEGMLFHSLAQPNSEAYWYQVAYRLAGPVDIDAAEYSLNALVQRHDVLRTVFDYEQTEGLLQLVVANRPATLSVTDLSVLSATDQEAALDSYLLNDRQSRVDLRKDNLMRVSLVRLATNEYVFIWSCHHILMDGWCMGVLIREYTALYESRLKQVSLTLPATTPFKTYLDWLSKKNQVEALGYWKMCLTDYDETASLPKNNQLQEGYAFAETQWTINDEQTSALKQLAIAHHITVNTLFQTIWGVLLSFYNNRNDVVFGAVTAGRPAEIPGIESAIGLFINTIPVRVKYQEADQFDTLLGRMQTQNLQSQLHQHVSLVSIQTQTTLRQSLFDHIIEFENYPIATLLTDEKTSSAWKVTGITSREHNGYDFTVVVTLDEQLHVKFQYNTLAISQQTIAGIERHFRSLVTQIIANPSIGLTALTITDEEDIKQVVHEYNRTTRAYPLDQTFADLFECQAAQTPNAPAVACQDRVLTYAELNARANQVANYLLTHAGLAPESMVGVMMERSEKSLVAMVGIMKARCVYVPIDPQLPSERRQYMLDDTGLRVVLIDNNSSIILDKPYTCVMPDQLGEYATTNPVVKRDAVDLAYVIYTSGSTGKPKGVMLEQRGLVNHLLSRIDSFTISVDSKVVQSASQSFDIHLWQSLAALLAGGQVLIIDRETSLNPLAFWQAVASNGATLLQVVPTYLVELLKVTEQVDVKLQLRYMLTIGEALKRPLVEKWFQQFPTIPLVNTYGPTEASDTITQYFMDELPENGLVPIGKPIHNMRIYLLDRYNRICPIGIKGELVVAGVGVGRGYLNNPEKTNQAFGQNPFRQGERLYRTGDVARWTPEGILEFFGRQDHQVKIRGHRIELGEVEEVLMKHPAVDNAAVLVYQDQHLVAYVKTTEPLSALSLREFLQQHVPEYMIPSFYVILDEFPLTASGKVNRKGLPSPDISTGNQAIESPQTTEQQTLVTIWEQLLNQSPIGINHNFFELGGDSIKAIQIVNRTRQAGYDLDIKTLFQHPVLADLSDYLRPSNALTTEQAHYEIASFTYDELNFEDVESINSMFN